MGLEGGFDVGFGQGGTEGGGERKGGRGDGEDGGPGGGGEGGGGQQDTAGQGEARDAFGLGTEGDDEGDLAEQRLAVEAAFAGDDEGGVGKALIEVLQVEDEGGARAETAVGQRQEGGPYPTRGTGTGLGHDGTALRLLKPLAEGAVAGFEARELCLGGTFLTGKEIGGAVRATKRAANIRAADDMQGIERERDGERCGGGGVREAEGGEEAAAAVVGGRAAETDEQMVDALTAGVGDEFAGAEGGGMKHIALVGMQEGEAGGGGHLDDGTTDVRRRGGGGGLRKGL